MPAGDKRERRGGEKGFVKGLSFQDALHRSQNHQISVEASCSDLPGFKLSRNFSIVHEAEGKYNIIGED